MLTCNVTVKFLYNFEANLFSPDILLPLCFVIHTAEETNAHFCCLLFTSCVKASDMSELMLLGLAFNAVFCERKISEAEKAFSRCMLHMCVTHTSCVTCQVLAEGRTWRQP